MPASVQALPILRNNSTSDLLLAGSIPPDNIPLVKSLRAGCGPQLVKGLLQNPEALFLYGAPMVLEPISPKTAGSVSPLPLESALAEPANHVLGADGKLQFQSDGKTELVLSAQSFDPESRHYIVIKATGNAKGCVPMVQLRAASEPFGDITAWLPLSAGGQTLFDRPTGFRIFDQERFGSRAPELLCYDLLRLPLFALSSQISAVRLRFNTPGNYEIQSVCF
jgi:hypothetical protein